MINMGLVRDVPFPLLTNENAVIVGPIFSSPTYPPTSFCLCLFLESETDRKEAGDGEKFLVGEVK